jgi:hypothetical protein
LGVGRDCSINDTGLRLYMASLTFARGRQLRVIERTLGRVSWLTRPAICGRSRPSGSGARICNSQWPSVNPLNDNDTARGWWGYAPAHEQRFAAEYLKCDADSAAWQMVRAASHSVGRWRSFRRKTCSVCRASTA